VKAGETKYVDRMQVGEMALTSSCAFDPVGRFAKMKIRVMRPHIRCSGGGVLVERTSSFPGGVTVSFRADGVGVWSYSNLQGPIVTTADKDGVRAATVSRYDPFGQVVDPATGWIGATAGTYAECAIGALSFGALGLGSVARSSARALSSHSTRAATRAAGESATALYLVISGMVAGSEADRRLWARRW
jgi:hypothetical protein